MSGTYVTKQTKKSTKIKSSIWTAPLFANVCAHIDFNYKTVHIFSNIQYNRIHFFPIFYAYVSYNLKLLCTINVQTDSIKVIYMENMR